MTATLTSTDLENDRCPACGKQLSRLSAPMTGDIAALIGRLRQYAGRWPEDKPPVFSEVAAHDDLLAAADALSCLIAPPPPPV